MRIPLKNGWTISLAEDTPPACVSVAALPSHDLDARADKWFKFGDSYDARCHSGEEMIEAILKVASAAPPERL